MKQNYKDTALLLDTMWQEYEELFDPDQDVPLRQAANMERFNTELTFAMFGSGHHAIVRREKEIAILRQELEMIEGAQREAMRFLPTSEESFGFFRPYLTESAAFLEA